MNLNRAILTISLLACSVTSYAGAPTCAVSSATNYCQYIGQVNQAYVNDNNAVILYFDTFMTAAQAATLGATQLHACIVDLSTAPGAQFGKMFYGTLLTAQATRRSVTVMMVGAFQGYPRCDRIWLPQ